MKRILLTALGIGQKIYKGQTSYKNTIYKLTRLYNTQYISEALICENNYDTVIFIGTKTSGWLNLLLDFSVVESQDEYFFDVMSNLENEEFLKELNDEYLNHSLSKYLYDYFIKNYNKEIKFEFVLMNMGINNEEIIYNLEKFIRLSRNKMGDTQKFDEIELDMDITHSFRSLPYLYDVMIRYVKSFDSDDIIKLKSIYYGMFEGSRYPKDKEAADFLLNKKILSQEDEQFLQSITDFSPAKVIDLSYIYNVNNWIIAVNEFSQFGNADNLVSLLRIYKHNNSYIDVEIDKLVHSLQDMSDSINSNQLSSVNQSMAGIKTSSYIFKNDNKSEFLDIIAGLLLNFVNEFEKPKDKNSIFNYKKTISSEFDLQYKMMYLFYRHKNYVSFLAAVMESMITFLMDDSKSNNHSERNDVKKIIRDFRSTINNKDGIEVRANSSNQRDEFVNIYISDRKAYNSLTINEKLGVFFELINTRRNYMMHLNISHTSKKKYQEYNTNFTSILGKVNESSPKAYKNILDEYNSLLKEYVLLQRN